MSELSIEEKHKQENEELEKRIAEMLAGAKSKNEKKRLNKEAEQMRRDLFEKQQKETVDPIIAAIAASTAANAEAVREKEREREEEETQKKALEEEKKRKKKANAKAQRERKQKQQLEERAQLAKIASEKSPGQIETEKIGAQILPLGFVIKPIIGDGHCLFRAVASGLALLGKEEYAAHDAFLELRKVCANEILSNINDYLPFSIYESNEKLIEHCKAIETTSEWGDALEVSALANALKLTIVVHSLGIDPQKYGTGQTEINLTFHSQFTKCGGHYNVAVQKQ
jgi:flagellar biosynthesis GTPase FlhF